MTASQALRGEVWLCALERGRGHEQEGTRPIVVISDDVFGAGPSGLAVVVPLTRTARGNWLHVPVTKGEGGLRADSVVRTDQIRSVSRDRLLRRWGTLTPDTMAAVDQRLRDLLDLAA